MSIKRNEAGEYLGLQCDTCGTPSPPTDEIMKAHGLNRMGWHCYGGTHICPACPHPTTAKGSVA